jgi:phosphotriesterase-related protein
MKLIEVILKHGLEDRLLLSQDAGWYNVGEWRGGKIRDYSFLVSSFVPMLEKKVRKELVDSMLVNNPAKAFNMS